MTAREIARQVALRKLSAEEVRIVTKEVFANADPRPSDLMLVFGAARSSGNWQPAASLLKAGLCARVLVTGGLPYESEGPLCEAEGIRAELMAAGVAPDIILVETRSRNTLENVLFARETLARSRASASSVLFYCKSHHSGRAWRTLVRHMPGISVCCATYDATYDGVTVRARDWHLTESAARRVLGEYERIICYSTRGDIA